MTPRPPPAAEAATAEVQLLRRATGAMPREVIVRDLVTTALRCISFLQVAFSAIGGNPEAARLAGIDINRVILINFMIAGLAYGITGIALTRA